MFIQHRDELTGVPAIVKTDGVLGGKARLDGRRVSVFHVGELYTVAGDTPEEIADQLDLSLAEVHAALAYNYEHPDEMAATRERRERVVADLAARSLVPEELAE